MLLTTIHVDIGFILILLSNVTDITNGRSGEGAGGRCISAVGGVQIVGLVNVIVLEVVVNDNLPVLADSARRELYERSI